MPFALLSLSLLTTPAQTLAGRFLSVFRVQDFQPITVSDQSLYGVPDLTKFGDMSPSRPFKVAPQTVGDVTAASVAVTRACPHMSATNAIAVVTIAVTRMTIATSRVIGARGAKNDAGIAKSPTAST